MARIEYSDEDRAMFLEVASEVGVTRAMKRLGYPHAWDTGNKWLKAAGIEVPLDDIKAQAAAHHDWYKTEELLTVVEQGLRRAVEALTRDDLTPDEQKKLSEAVQKYTNSWLLLQNKATSISESRTQDTADLAIMDLLNAENARNTLMEMEGSPDKT